MRPLLRWWLRCALHRGAVGTTAELGRARAHLQARVTPPAPPTGEPPGSHPYTHLDDDGLTASLLWPVAALATTVTPAAPLWGARRPGRFNPTTRPRQGVGAPGGTNSSAVAAPSSTHPCYAPSYPITLSSTPCAGVHDPPVRTGYGISHGLFIFSLNFKASVPILSPTSYPKRYPVGRIRYMYSDPGALI